MNLYGEYRLIFKQGTGQLRNHLLLLIIIQQIVTLSKYGHDALNIRHP